MEVTVEPVGACQVKVSFTVPSSEFQSQVRRDLQRIAGGTRMKGFRPGKTPLKVVEREYGERVRFEAAQHFLQRAYQKAIQEHDLAPAAHPRVSEEDLKPPGESDYQGTFELLLRPRFELGAYAGLPLEARPVSVAEEEIQAAREDVRRSHSRPEPVSEGGLPEDGVALAKLELVHEGEVVAGREGLRIAPQDPPAGVEPEAFRQALVGASEGARIELPYDFPEGFERPELVGRQGTVRIELAQVFRVVVPTDEELSKAFGVEGPSDLDGAIADRIREMKQRMEQRRQESELLERVLEAHPMELPEPLVEEHARSQVQPERERLASEGRSEEEVESGLAEPLRAAREAVSRSLRAVYLMEAIAQKEGIGVTESELASELRQIAQRNEASFEEVRDYYREQGLSNQLALELLERKVRTLLRERASIEETS